MNIEITDKGRAEYDALVRDAKRWRHLFSDEIGFRYDDTIYYDSDRAGAAVDQSIAAMGASHE